MELAEIVICECCMVMAVNNESCGLTDEEAHPAGLLGLCDSHVIVGGPPNLGFSFIQCEGCGTILGGNRYTAYVEIES